MAVRHSTGWLCRPGAGKPRPGAGKLRPGAGKLRPGAKAKLTLLRDKKEMEIEVTLGSRPAARPRLPFGFPPRK